MERGLLSDRKITELYDEAVWMYLHQDFSDSLEDTKQLSPRTNPSTVSGNPSVSAMRLIPTGQALRLLGIIACTAMQGIRALPFSASFRQCRWLVAFVE